MTYLEELASNYARLSHRGDQRPCDVNQIVQRVMSEARTGGEADLRTELAPNSAVVLGDPVAIRRIVENLVTNAVESLGSAPGRVTVTTAVVSEALKPPIVRIAVSDTGTGMNVELRERVFEDFFTTKDEGTGLGLSIVRRLVMDLSGSVRVSSEPGKGSRFIVELPAHGAIAASDGGEGA